MSFEGPPRQSPQASVRHHTVLGNPTGIARLVEDMGHPQPGDPSRTTVEDATYGSALRNRSEDKALLRVASTLWRAASRDQPLRIRPRQTGAKPPSSTNAGGPLPASCSEICRRIADIDGAPAMIEEDVQVFRTTSAPQCRRHENGSSTVPRR